MKTISFPEFESFKRSVSSRRRRLDTVYHGYWDNSDRGGFKTTAQKCGLEDEWESMERALKKMDQRIRKARVVFED